jgi:hypothetical protein
VKKSIVLLATVVISGVLSSCGGVKSTKEYKDVQSKIEKLQAEIATAKKEKAKLTKDIETKTPDYNSAVSKARSAVAEAKAQSDSTSASVGEALMDNAVRARVAQQLWLPACIERVMLSNESEGKFDSEEDQLDYVNEKQGDSNEYWYYAALYDAGDPQGFQKLEDETDALSGSCNQKGHSEFAKKCEKFDPLVLKKDPERFKGKCLFGTVRIEQMDSNTGPCAFQGYVGGGYDVRAQFGMTTSTLTHSAFKDCDWADRLKENMSVTFIAYGLGAYSYETTSGGNQTVPAFNLINTRQ